jgi:flagellar biosynthetic protein FliQ
MTEEFILHLAKEVFYTVLMVSAPILGVTLIVGLIISIFQAATSIQEMTLTFVPKIIVVAIVVILTLPWMLDTLVSFTTNLFNMIPAIAH